MINNIYKMYPEVIQDIDEKFLEVIEVYGTCYHINDETSIIHFNEMMYELWTTLEELTRLKIVNYIVKLISKNLLSMDDIVDGVTKQTSKITFPKEEAFYVGSMSYIFHEGLIIGEINDEY